MSSKKTPDTATRSPKNKKGEAYYDDDDDAVTEDGNVVNYESRRALKRRKASKRRRRVLVVFLLCLVGFIIYLNWNVLSPSAISEWLSDTFGLYGTSKYPVTFNQGGYKAAVPMGNYLGVLTDTSYLVYSPSGTLLDTREHGMGSPTIVAAGSKAIIYDEGGTSFKTETRDGESDAYKTDFDITSAAVGTGGDYAIVTGSDTYLSELTVYNRNNDKVFKWYSSTGRILCAALSPDGSRVAAIVISAKSGNIVSSLYVFATDKQNPDAIKSYDGDTFFSLQFKGNSEIAAVGDLETVFFTSGGKERSRYSYDNKTLKCFSNTPSATVLVFSKYGVGNESTLVSLDGSGRIRGQMDSPDDIDAVYGADTISAIAQNKIIYASDDFKTQQTISVQNDSLGVMTVKNYVYIFGQQTVYQYKEK